MGQLADVSALRAGSVRRFKHLAVCAVVSMWAPGLAGADAPRRSVTCSGEPCGSLCYQQTRAWLLVHARMPATAGEWVQLEVLEVFRGSAPQEILLHNVSHNWEPAVGQEPCDFEPYVPVGPPRLPGGVEIIAGLVPDEVEGWRIVQDWRFAGRACIEGILVVEDKWSCIPSSRIPRCSRGWTRGSRTPTVARPT